MKVEADASVLPGQIAFRFDSRVEREFDRWKATEDGEFVMHQALVRACAMKRAGFAHYSIDAILHAIRFDQDLEAGPDQGFKINNSRSAYIARALMAEYPYLEGFFETRVLRGR